MKSFLSSGGVISPAPVSPPAVAPNPVQSAAVSTAASNPPKKLSVSDAFGSVEDTPIVTPPATATNNSHHNQSNDNVSSSDIEGLSTGVVNLTDASKKLISTQNAALEVYFHCCNISKIMYL